MTQSAEPYLTIVQHLLFTMLLVLFLVVFFSLHHHFEKTCILLIARDLDQLIILIRSWGLAALPSISFDVIGSMAELSSLAAGGNVAVKNSLRE